MMASKCQCACCKRWAAHVEAYYVLSSEGKLKDAVIEAARPVSQNVTPENWCELQRALEKHDAVSTRQNDSTYPENDSPWESGND